jgi:hypothetical protein
MDDPLGFFLREERLHAGTIRQVQPVEAESWVPLQSGQTSLLEADVVVVVEIIESDHLITPTEQQLGGVETNESGRAGHEDFHNVI